MAPSPLNSICFTSYEQLSREAIFCQFCLLISISFTITFLTVSCAVGTYLDAASDSCKPCPTGTYQSEAGQLQCIPCPAIAGQAGVTQASGSRSAADCKGKSSTYNNIGSIKPINLAELQYV